jgi:hypothetical protein
MRRRFNSGLRFDSDRLVRAHFGTSYSGFLIVVVVMVAVTMMIMVVTVVFMVVVVTVTFPEVNIATSDESCLIAFRVTHLKASLKYLFILMVVMVVVAFVVTFVVMVTFVFVVAAFLILVTFTARFITFIFVLLVAIGLGLTGSARHSGYRNARSTAGSRIIGASSTSSSHNVTSGKGGLCTPGQIAVISSGNGISRGSAEGDSSKDYRSLGSDHFAVRLEEVVECERYAASVCSTSSWETLW